MSEGKCVVGEGKYDLAIQAFDSVIARKPNDANAYNSRGNVYAAKREPDRAIQDYDSSIKLSPNNPLSYKNRGTTYTTQDQYDRAIQDLDQAIKLGRFTDAASDLERSLELYQAATPPTGHLNETGAYAVIWLHVAKLRWGLDDGVEFAANSARIDSTSWPSPVIAFYSGKLTADQLVAGTANAEPTLRKDQRCGAEFFAGQAALWTKQPAEARKRLEATRETCSKRHVEHAAAVAELDRLGATAE